MMLETLVVLALTGCTLDGAELACRFPAPTGLPQRQVRLEVACSGTVLLNGSTVEGGTTVRKIHDLLIGRGENILRMRKDCAPAKLLVTPRVYVSGVRPEGNGLTVTVENSLDNTVSIGLVCNGPAGSGAASTTIPANGLAELSLALRAKGKITCVLEKVPEAVEESYRFQFETIYQ